MPTCPQCTKELREFSRRCPTCQADLDLLVDYVSDLQVGLDRAEHLTREGALGQAFWAYLEVLEVDPDNPTARQQIGQVVTVVRQFDRCAPSQRLANGTLGQRGGTGGLSLRNLWILVAGATLFAGLTFAIGYLLGAASSLPATQEEPKEPPALTRPQNSLGG